MLSASTYAILSAHPKRYGKIIITFAVVPRKTEVFVKYMLFLWYVGLRKLVVTVVQLCGWYFNFVLIDDCFNSRKILSVSGYMEPSGHNIHSINSFPVLSEGQFWESLKSLIFLILFSSLSGSKGTPEDCVTQK